MIEIQKFSDEPGYWYFELETEDMANAIAIQGQLIAYMMGWC